MFTINSSNKKAIFWLFGLLLSINVFILIKNIDYFAFLNSPKWLPLIIMLVVLLLFWVLGSIISKVPIGIYSLKFQKSDINEINRKINSDFKEEEFDTLVSNLRNIMHYISKNNYSQKTIDDLSDYVGFDKKIVSKLVANSKRLRFIKIIYWIFGIVLSIFNYVIITNFNYFNFISSVWFLPYSLSLVVLLLFFSEGIFATKMPSSFYLNILNINKKDIIETENKINEKSKVYAGYKNQEKESITKLKNTVAYLLKMKIKKEVIEELFKSQGFSNEIVTKLIASSKNNLSKINNVRLDDKYLATLRLFVFKVHDEFVSLKEIYTKINSIDNEIKNLKDKQTKLEKMSKTKISKAVIKKVVSKNYKEKDSVKFKYDSLNSKRYANKIKFIFNMLKPFAEKYSEKDVRLLLLSQNYEPYIIDDVIKKLKDNKIIFSSKNKSLSENFVYVINNLYARFSRNN